MTSTSSSDLLLHQTRIRFPAFSDAKVRIAPIEKGGSDRKFYRVRFSADQTIILVKYNLEREENRLYVQIAEFLAEHKICAPKVYFHDPEEGLIWIEDLGTNDLWSHREDNWMVRRALYESALQQAALLHGLPLASIRDIRPHLAPEFNTALYQWEQNYFFENCLGRYFGLSGKQIAELADLPAFHEIAQTLSDQRRVLVHRDFQSQNIIVRNGQAHLIDFQGMRPGLAEYDLASLLYDPYVTLSSDERGQLIEYYWSQREDAASDAARPAILNYCAMQRLMQALGAYGFLGLVKGSKSFLKYIGPAIASLHALMASEPRFRKMERVLATLSINDQTR